MTNRVDNMRPASRQRMAASATSTDSAAWRNPADTRATHYNEAKPSSDKFALRFVRPR
jgi:hypothetical protein